MAAAGLARRVCAVGKSMLLRRSDLDRVGGLELLGVHLAEDQVCGERIAALGLATAVVAPAVDNVLGGLTLRQVVGRHLRWARIRRRMAPAAYAAELVANPVPWALLAAAVDLTPLTLGIALAALVGAADSRSSPAGSGALLQAAGDVPFATSPGCPPSVRFVGTTGNGLGHLGLRRSESVSRTRTRSRTRSWCTR